MSRAPVRFGVIGCGAIAFWTHLRELPRIKGARLVAAADPDAAARERVERLARIPVHAETSELLARRDIDAVVICAASGTHAELAVAVAQSGRHFYLEKPIATSADDARRVVEAAREAGIIGAMGFNRRRHPAFEQARELVATGKIGRVRAAHTTFSEPAQSLPEWKRRRATGGGALLDLASHHLDLLRWLLADEIAGVEARIVSEKTEHDSAWVQLGMRGGARAASFFSFRAGRADALELIGEHGALRVDRFRGSVSLQLARRWGYGVRRAFVPRSCAALAWRIARLARPSWESSYRRALASFTSLCRGGPGAVATLDDGVRSLAAVLAAEESARVGKAVQLEPRPA